MTKIEELRAELLNRLDTERAELDSSEKTLVDLETQVQSVRQRVLFAVAQLQAHDAAVAALTGQDPQASPPTVDGASRRTRRNIVAEVESRLGPIPVDVDMLVLQIGSVRPEQIVTALDKLRTTGRAFLVDRKWTNQSQEPSPGGTVTNIQVTEPHHRRNDAATPLQSALLGGLEPVDAD